MLESDFTCVDFVLFDLWMSPVYRPCTV